MREQNLSNISTETEGLLFLRDKINKFLLFKDTKDKDTKKILFERDITIDQKKRMYNIANIDYKKYKNSVDAIVLHVDDIDSVKSIKDFDFVEVKATKKKSVHKLPYNVFFGFTKNEEELFKTCENYKLCFVHVSLKKYYFINYSEYCDLIHSKRIQYQITFKKND